VGGSSGVGGTGGNTAGSSAGAVQIGGGNAADESAGAGQSGPVTVGPTATFTDPLTGESVTVGGPTTIGGSGGNRATGSVGVFQVGGGNRSAGSAGTVQVGGATSGPTRTGGETASPPSGSPTPTPAAGAAPVDAGTPAEVRRALGPAGSPAGTEHRQTALQGGRLGANTSLGAAVPAGTLPFTGLSLLLAVLLGFALVAAGSALRLQGRVC
jgi:hypothetical protein